MLKIGTVDTKLASWQAEYTQAELQRIGVESELVIFDSGTGSRGMEQALLGGELQVAVHTMKDLPTMQPEGLVITAVSRRDNPSDLLVIRPESVDTTQIFRLASGAKVGASSVRRQAQLRDIRPDLEILDLSGDAPARLQNLKNGSCDAVFLSAAALQPSGLNLDDLEVLELNPREFIPAPAQGVLAWQTHRDDLPTRRLFKQLHHSDVSACTNIERGVLRLLGDASPLGVFVERDAVGNYHAFAACELDGALRRARLSQSTSAGLADRLVALLREG